MIHLGRWKDPAVRAMLLATVVVATACCQPATARAQEAGSAPHAPSRAAAQAAPSAPPSATTARPETAAAESSATSLGRAPVVVRGRTLFYVNQRMFSISPADRAKLASSRIDKAYRDPNIRMDSVRVVDEATTSSVVAGDMALVVVGEDDARAAGVSRHQLAENYAEIIRDSAKQIRREYGLRSLLFGLLWSLLATIGLLLVLRGFGVVFPKLYGRLESWRGTRIPSLRIQRLELLPADRITDLLVTLAKWIRIGAVVLVLYIFLQLLLSFFPWTQGYAAIIFNSVLRPLRHVGKGFVDYLPNLFFIGVIVLVSFYGVRLVRFFFHEMSKGTIQFPGFYPDWIDPTYKIVKFMIIAFTVIAVFPYLPGSDSPAFKGVSLFLGLLFSLGSSSAISNVVAGLVLTYTRAFQLGDRVKIGDTMGDVVEKNFLVTRVRTVKNVDISVPNSMVLSSHIVNYSSTEHTDRLILHTSVTIGYDAPWRQVHELLLAAAAATPHLLGDPKPFVLQTALGDFYVHYELNAYTDDPALMGFTYSELHQNIQDRFNEAGVEIMSPHYSSLRDGNTMAIPRESLPSGYEPPEFRVGPRAQPAPEGDRPRGSKPPSPGS